MELKEAFLKVVRDNYANFEGRARRKEYWMYILTVLIIGAVFGILGKIASLFTYISGLVSLALFIPGIAVTVRRLHDTNKSGWFILVFFIPFIGWIYLFYLLVLEGDKASNQYGPDPKAIENGSNHPFNQSQDPFGSSRPQDPFGSSQPSNPAPPAPDKDPFA
ncbi:DUF805 domain-containing protein [Sphingobacterium siyangense]|uniref:DUF805 domain-containing protein n=1 Tax=Sphingobacterium siyangense TaxID=459529 RepID=UPI0019629BAE|nr:DUF805 domain-containing protein [Sphingobacterium siyangense]QRY58433.1 DUF805 domain-containing protein [Sphingobacterium siyangense]